MHNKIYSFLGLATKASKLLSGDETCERAIRSGRVLLVIIALDASENTKKKFSDACKHKEIEIRFFGEKESLGRYIGKQNRSVIGITDEGFGEKLQQMIDGLNIELGGGFIDKNQSI